MSKVYWESKEDKKDKRLFIIFMCFMLVGIGIMFYVFFDEGIKNHFYENENNICTATGTLEDIQYTYHIKGGSSLEYIKLKEYSCWFYLPDLYLCAVDENELEEAKILSIIIAQSDQNKLEIDTEIQVLEIKSDQGMIVSKEDYRKGLLIETILRYLFGPIVIVASIWLVVYLWKIEINDDDN